MTTANQPPAATTTSLPVIPSNLNRPKPSRMSRKRAYVLIAVHLALLTHIAHWLWTGRSLSPVEPYEAMYTLNDGHLNAGFIFFALAILATLVMGRFVCGWGCHFIAYQDLSTSFMKKLGIKPKPFRSRLLIFAPLALAIYMFVWPTLYRVWHGIPSPTWTNHIIKTNFWETFPGPVIFILTVATAGFAIVYFLGSKGFCTYACPYGGFFRFVEPLSPGRIRVTDACKHCGHCTASCTSNVRVHEEVALYGMVVDPGCMKCFDCVSVCPNDALYYGFGLPSLGARPTSKKRAVHYDLSLPQELLAGGIGLASLLIFRGLYNQVPLLMAMGLSCITVVITIKCLHLVMSTNVRLQQLQLKRGRKLTRHGTVFISLALIWSAFTLHSGFIQYSSAQGRIAMAQLALDDDIWMTGKHWWTDATSDQRDKLDYALTHLQRADRWGLMTTASILQDLVWLHIARGRTDAAEVVIRRVIDNNQDRHDAHRALACVLKKLDRNEEVIASYHRALELDPTYDLARRELSRFLIAQEKPDQAIDLLQQGISTTDDPQAMKRTLGDVLNELQRFNQAQQHWLAYTQQYPTDARGFIALAVAESALGHRRQSLRHFKRAVTIAPESPAAQYNLGYALLAGGQTNEAIEHLTLAAKFSPNTSLYHYNLAVALLMNQQPQQALHHIERAIQIDPKDPDARGFLQVVKQQLSTPQP